MTTFAVGLDFVTFVLCPHKQLQSLYLCLQVLHTNVFGSCPLQGVIRVVSTLDRESSGLTYDTNHNGVMALVITAYDRDDTNGGNGVNSASVTVSL